jgi:cysteinyl-tRNA synthetase
MGCITHSSEWDMAIWKGGKGVNRRVSAVELPLSDSLIVFRLHRQQHAFRVALCDSFNTPQALQILLDLVSTTNVYLKRGRSAINIGVVRQVAGWITKMLRMFGLGEGAPREIGWGVVQEEGEGSADVSDTGDLITVADITSQREAILMPYMRTLSTFRDEVRRKAMAKQPHSEFLELTDRLRDDELVPLGVALDDQEGESWLRYNCLLLMSTLQMGKR